MILLFYNDLLIELYQIHAILSIIYLILNDFYTIFVSYRCRARILERIFGEKVKFMLKRLKKNGGYGII